MYHGVSRSDNEPISPGAARFWVIEDQFRAQLRQTVAFGYRTVLLDDFVDAREAGNVALLTFDDGNKSDYEVAFPALAEVGLQAIFFLNSSNVGAAKFLNWREILEMQRVGMSFQSHGRDHMDFRQLSPRELDRQLRDSKNVLEDGLGRSVNFFAAPHGLFNDLVTHRALEVGYRAICSACPLPARPDRKVLTRVGVYRETPLREFRQLLDGSPLAYGRRIADWVAYSPVRVIKQYAWARHFGRRVRTLLTSHAKSS